MSLHDTLHEQRMNALNNAKRIVNAAKAAGRHGYGDCVRTRRRTRMTANSRDRGPFWARSPHPLP